MTFNSVTFVLFFALVLGAHQLPLPWRLKKSNLLIASYIFYSAWNPPFVAILMASTLFDWIAARLIDKAQMPGRRRVYMVLSLVMNLGLLGFFKYNNFLLVNVIAAASLAGIEFHPIHADIVLPIGISFYTFQSLSYTIGVYRREVTASPSLLDYALYVTFFPQLVSGPIARAKDFLPQIATTPPASTAQIGWGLSLLVIGLFNKLVIADQVLAGLADRLYAADAVPDLATAWCGTIAFAGQILCDFSGYSCCAIGIAMCFGLALPDNFHFPYAAIGFSDFWHRWHISLSTWLRDYLYITLGGSRRGKFRTHANLLTTMVLGGLWHGASWTFVIWGGLHGMFLVAERSLRGALPQHPLARSRPLQVLAALLTFAMVCLAWVFFRADSLSDALVVVKAMLGLGGQHPTLVFSKRDMLTVVVVLGSILTIHWWMRNSSLEAAASRLKWPLKSCALAAMIFLICTMPGADRAFIYFQF